MLGNVTICHALQELQSNIGTSSILVNRKPLLLIYSDNTEERIDFVESTGTIKT
jgi:hypothetical protein